MASLFLQFRGIPRSCWILYWPGFVAQCQNGFPMRLQTGSMKRTYRCMGAASWHCRPCSPGLLGAQSSCGSEPGILPETRTFCFHSMMFRYSSVVISRRTAETSCFPHHSCVWCHPHTFCSPIGYFPGFWCRRKAFGLVPAFWERDDGKNHPALAPKPGERWAHADLQITVNRGFKFKFLR